MGSLAPHARQLLLAMGGLYLLSDAQKKNIAQVEQVIGDRSAEARMALYASSMGVVGGGIEFVGIALEKGAGRIQALGGGQGEAAARMGKIVARAGAAVGAAAGLLDAAHAAIALNRSAKGGDASAVLNYGGSMLLSGTAAGFGIYAAAMKTSTLMGPLGIAITLGVLGYLFFKKAEGKESTPLERWARRCAFGVDDEVPSLRWTSPSQAAIAIAELNAATLGVEAGTHFNSRIADSGAHGFGSIAPPVYERHLDYWFLLPYFDSNRSAYRWSLTVHRYGDGSPSNYSGGEIVAEGSFNPPSKTTVASEQRAALAAPKLPTIPDFQQNSATPKINIRSVTLNNGRPMQLKEIRGRLVLLPDLRKHNIEGATLSLTYWPDRNTPDAYAEIVIFDSQ